MSTKVKSLVVLVALTALMAGSAFTARADGEPSQDTFQAANLFTFGDPTDLLPGAANLTRTGDGISFRVYATALDVGAHTVWIVIFNEPKNCAAGPGGCMGPDLGNPAVKGSIVYGTGYSVGGDGVATFHGSLKEGDPELGRQVNVPAGTVNGLKDSKKAEIHLVVRSHGPAVAGAAAEQFSTFESDCAACQDVQAVIFEAVGGGDDDADDD